MLACAAHSATYTFNSGFASGGAIPDGNPTGWSDTRTISGWSAGSQITALDVSLNVSGGFNGDLYCYLSHGSGFSVLLNRVGVSSANSFGYGDTGFAITLNDSGAFNVHSYQANGGTLNGNGQLTGTWRPDGRNIGPASSGATFDSTSPSTPLSEFNNLDPNGGWTLFFADMSAGGQSTVVNWSLDITAVPEPVNGALMIFAAAGCGAVLVRTVRSGRAV
jgi:hypothetical protein